MLERIRSAKTVSFLARMFIALAVEIPGANSEAVTRVSDGSQAYWVEQVTEGLDFPASMDWLPNGDMLISERIGSLRILRGRELDPKPVSGMPPSYPSYFDGLREVLVDPDYKRNRFLYFLISEGTFERHHAAVYRARYGATGLEDVTRIFRSHDEVGGYIQIASRMTFFADKTLLIAIPDDRHGHAQSLSSHRGKILRINRDGSIPSNNPFLNTAGALPEIWSYGHRIPLGFHQDSQSGAILEIESGPRGGDELNILKVGGNYGWPRASWGFAYNNKGIEAPLQSFPGIENPILIWTPSVTPSGLTRYRGNVYPLWDGDYFIGHLTTRAVERLRVDGQQVILRERLLLDLSERIRDVKVGPDNHLYVLTDHQNGRVLRLRPGRPRSNQLARVAKKIEERIERGSMWDFPVDAEDELATAPEDLEKGRAEFLERCAACHSIGTLVRGGEIGPDLDNVYGSIMGRKAGFDYSVNMADGQYLWNFATLNRFLSNPNGYVPGTIMASAPVTDAEVRRYIIAFLKKSSE